LKTENCKLYYLAFSHFFGIGPVKLKTLINYFGSVKKAYNAKEKYLSPVIGPVLTKKFLHFKNIFDPVKRLTELKKKQVSIISWEDKKYPVLLKNISDPPICLYVRGNIDDFNFSKLTIGIVGTRTPTIYGQQIARKFSSELTTAGFTIVSGLALGVDAIAHWQCLNSKGVTIAVLGCGVNVIYPADNRNLYYKIIEKGGLIISEFPPEQLVLKGLFIARNRIISGLSKGVIVIEGGEHSGALITAKYAAEQGRDVFAPPAPINSDMSKAPNILLKEGAKLITSVNDVFDEFNLKITPAKKEDILRDLSVEEKIIIEILAKKSMVVDEIVVSVKIPTNQVLNMLSVLEINGIIEKNSQNQYQLRF
jgi:DNA processing protein